MPNCNNLKNSIIDVIHNYHSSWRIIKNLRKAMEGYLGKGNFIYDNCFPQGATPKCAWAAIYDYRFINQKTHDYRFVNQEISVRKIREKIDFNIAYIFPNYDKKSRNFYLCLLVRAIRNNNNEIIDEEIKFRAEKLRKFTEIHINKNSNYGEFRRNKLGEEVEFLAERFTGNKLQLAVAFAIKYEINNVSNEILEEDLKIISQIYQELVKEFFEKKISFEKSVN
jgi:hypothetical protein